MQEGTFRLRCLETEDLIESCSCSLAYFKNVPKKRVMEEPIGNLFSVFRFKWEMNPGF